MAECWPESAWRVYLHPMSVEDPSVKNNTALQSMYGGGGFLVAVGIVVLIIGWAISASPNYDGMGPAVGGTITLVAGAFIINLGVLLLVGAGIAHAVNWQLVNRDVMASRTRPQMTFTDYTESKSNTPPPSDWP